MSSLRESAGVKTMVLAALHLILAESLQRRSEGPHHSTAPNSDRITRFV